MQYLSDYRDSSAHRPVTTDSWLAVCGHWGVSGAALSHPAADCGLFHPCFIVRSDAPPLWDAHVPFSSDFEGVMNPQRLVKRQTPMNPASAASWHGAEGLARSTKSPGAFKVIKHWVTRPFVKAKKAMTSHQGARPGAASPPRPRPHYARNPMQGPQVPLHPDQHGYKEAVKAQEPLVQAAIAAGRRPVLAI